MKNPDQLFGKVSVYITTKFPSWKVVSGLSNFFTGVIVRKVVSGLSNYLKSLNNESCIWIEQLLRLVLSAKSTLCPTISVPLMMVLQGFWVFSCRRKHLMQDEEPNKAPSKNNFHRVNKRSNIIQKQPTTIH